MFMKAALLKALSYVRLWRDPLEFLMLVNQYTRAELELRKYLVTESYDVSTHLFEELHYTVHKMLEKILEDDEENKIVLSGTDYQGYTKFDRHTVHVRPIRVVSYKQFQMFVWRWHSHYPYADTPMIGLAKSQYEWIIHVDKSLYKIQALDL